jgi:hypothetical protein
MTAPASPLILPARSAKPAAAATRPAMARPRFTVDGDAELERHLATTCDRIGAGLRGLLPARKLQAVMLGGGYGRGEGGVLRDSAGDRPYNDLEFYVFLRGNRHLNRQVYQRALHVFGEILTPQAGIEVEFHIGSLDELAASGVTMFSYDLVTGHRWLVGDESRLAGCSHHRNADEIPVSEATRLMMNRCTGLLLAGDRLARGTFTAADADFVARNIAKAQLGAGDAVLAVFAQYHWSVRERHLRLERLARGERSGWWFELCAHHAAGERFKLHPFRSTATREELAACHQAVTAFCRQVWLWLENRRLKGSFGSVVDYSDPHVRKWADAAGVRNVLVNAKLLGPAAALTADALRHPRERVLNALPLLLWQPDALASPALRSRLQSELRTTATNLSDMVAAYRDLWSQVN